MDAHMYGVCICIDYICMYSIICAYMYLYVYIYIYICLYI